MQHTLCQFYDTLQFILFGKFITMFDGGYIWRIFHWIEFRGQISYLISLYWAQFIVMIDWWLFNVVRAVIQR
jgi:hypothetical protein